MRSSSRRLGSHPGHHYGTNHIEQQASEPAKNTMEYNLALSLMTSQFHTFE